MQINIRNISKDFFDYYENAKELNFEDKVKLWKDLYENKNKDIFDAFLDLAHEFDKNYKLEDSYENAFKKHEKVYEKIINISKTIDGEILTIIDKCNKLFQVKDKEINKLDFIVLVGLSMADGWNIQFKDEPTTFFAMECMSNELENVRVFLSHEITHGFHTKLVKFDKNQTLAESLFTEGLAVAISEEMFPGFDESRYLWVGMKSDKDWLDKCISILPRLGEGIKRNLDDIEGIQPLYFGQGSEEIPMKAGYVYGYYMIKEFLKKHSFSEIIRWDKYRIREEVKQYCEKL